jgi:hypothetical protein
MTSGVILSRKRGNRPENLLTGDVDESDIHDRIVRGDGAIHIRRGIIQDSEKC